MCPRTHTNAKLTRFCLSECYLQFKKPNSQKQVTCPFCNSLNYAVKYTGCLTKEERSILEKVCLSLSLSTLSSVKGERCILDQVHFSLSLSIFFSVKKEICILDRFSTSFNTAYSHTLYTARIQRLMHAHFLKQQSRPRRKI